MDFGAKKIIRDKERSLYILKQFILQEDITNLNVYAPNCIKSKYMKQKLLELKVKIGKSTIIVNSPISNSQTQQVENQ